MKNFQKLMGGAVLALMLTTVACQDTGSAVSTPADANDNGGGSSKEADLQKQIDDLLQQIEDLKNGKPSEAGLTLADIVGHWTALSDVSTDANGNTVDVLASAGISYDLVIKSDGSYTSTTNNKSGQQLETFSDLLSVADGHTLVMDGQPLYTVSLSAAGVMKWVNLADNTHAITWKKAATKPAVNPIIDPVDPSI